MRLLVIKPEPLARRLLKLAGTTYAAEAGIRIRDKPMPLFQLLVLCMLASKPIGAATAARAARELFCSGLRTPKAVLSAERQTMISAFGRAHYVRYDESSATRLTAIARRAAPAGDRLTQVRDRLVGCQAAPHTTGRSSNYGQLNHVRHCWRGTCRG